MNIAVQEFDRQKGAAYLDAGAASRDGSPAISSGTHATDFVASLRGPVDCAPMFAS